MSVHHADRTPSFSFQLLTEFKLGVENLDLSKYLSSQNCKVMFFHKFVGVFVHQVLGVVLVFRVVCMAKFRAKARKKSHQGVKVKVPESSCTPILLLSPVNMVG